MGDKRKRSLSTRDAAVNRRRSTTVEEPKPPIAEGSESPDVPTFVNYNGPLPTLPNPQAEDLPTDKYQTVEESGVMKEALRRSREAWLSEDEPIFEKFWTKPLKKRLVDEKKNPPKDCMTKVGDCELIIEPHVFEIKLYGVRDTSQQALEPGAHNQQQPPPSLPLQQHSQPNSQYHQHPQQQQQQQQQATQNKAAASNPSQPPTQRISAPVSQAPAQPQLPQVNPPPPFQPQHQQYAHPYTLPLPTSQRPAYMIPGGPLPHPSLNRPGVASPYPRPSTPTNQSTLQTLLPPPLPSIQNPPQAHSSQPPTASATHLSPSGHSAHPTQQSAQPQQAPPQQPPPARPDPVIQLLATKAASDPDLKALMRVVATGKASPEELKVFQKYIDELTPMANAIKARQAEEDRLAALRTQQQPQQPPPHLTPQPNISPQPCSSHPPVQPCPPQQQQPYTQNHQQLHVLQNPLPSYPKPRMQPPQVVFQSVVFEFIGSTHGDRFLFPKYSILEISENGRTLLASFLLLRPLEPVPNCTAYYQPITVCLKTQNPKTLEFLQKVVAGPEVVREYMKEEMKKRIRAPKSWLVYRLKRSSDGTIVDEDEKNEGQNVPPSAKLKDSRRRRQSSTPLAEGKNAANTPLIARSGPRVKVIKKSSSAGTAKADFSGSNSKSSSSAAASAFASNAPKVQLSPPMPKQHKPKLHRSRKGRIADPTKSCHMCNTSKTSLWRKAEIDGDSVTVCNACGIKWKTQTTRQAANAAAIANGELPQYDEEGKTVSRNKRSSTILGSGANVSTSASASANASASASMSGGGGEGVGVGVEGYTYSPRVLTYPRGLPHLQISGVTKGSASSGGGLSASPSPSLPHASALPNSSTSPVNSLLATGSGSPTSHVLPQIPGQAPSTVLPAISTSGLDVVTRIKTENLCVGNHGISSLSLPTAPLSATSSSLSPAPTSESGD